MLNNENTGKIIGTEVNSNRAICRGEKTVRTNERINSYTTCFLYVSIILNIFFISHVALRLFHVSSRQLPMFAWSLVNKHAVTCF